VYSGDQFSKLYSKDDQSGDTQSLDIISKVQSTWWRGFCFLEPWIWNLKKANCITCEVEFGKYWKGSHTGLKNSLSGLTGYEEKLFHGDECQLEQAACRGSAASVLGGFQDQARWSPELPDLTSYCTLLWARDWGGEFLRCLLNWIVLGSSQYTGSEDAIEIF